MTMGVANGTSVTMASAPVRDQTEVAAGCWLLDGALQAI